MIDILDPLKLVYPFDNETVYTTAETIELRALGYDGHCVLFAPYDTEVVREASFTIGGDGPLLQARLTRAHANGNEGALIVAEDVVSVAYTLLGMGPDWKEWSEADAGTIADAEALFTGRSSWTKDPRGYNFAWDAAGLVQGGTFASRDRAKVVITVTLVAGGSCVFGFEGVCV